ncbi:uncharacterized protein LOC106460512 [Limulus polyphemus]|uniref:Uncharacterized protein LOC106460512 n=1 Tax=Limulus polyphemus TaxID=6850 RepID=A0ABM1B6A6_LIMPO|nr:uncharacterized protein LOC106460512 [Limulus polyphemus]XP_013775678.1 uncharacterized protein LOC106460512 [Limulus polyphemus]XP_013775681.1 uncharacterized protein LOC106460512 [Limulus polyphemus]XP_022242967.1 uncharacterized protein LOC106460512 [Limulus polyphemus]
MMYICWLLSIVTVAYRSAAFPRPPLSTRDETSAATPLPWMKNTAKQFPKTGQVRKEKLVQQEFSTTIPIPRGLNLNRKLHISEFTNQDSHNPFLDMSEGTVPPRNRSFSDFAIQIETTLSNHQLPFYEGIRHFNELVDQKTDKSKGYDRFPIDNFALDDHIRSTGSSKSLDGPKHEVEKQLDHFLTLFMQPQEGHAERFRRKWPSIFQEEMVPERSIRPVHNARMIVFPDEVEEKDKSTSKVFSFEDNITVISKVSRTTTATATQAPPHDPKDRSTQLEELSSFEDLTTIPNVSKSSKKNSKKGPEKNKNNISGSDDEKLHELTIRNLIIGAVISAVALVFFTTFLIACRWRQRSKRMVKRSEKFIDEVSTSASSKVRRFPFRSKNKTTPVSSTFQ